MSHSAFLKLSQGFLGVALSCRLNSGFMRIVVVDDDRRFGSHCAVRWSSTATPWSSPRTDSQQAMDVVARRRPDAMVLDMMMPRVDGLEVCRRLRGAGDDLPVLVLTARDAVSDRVAGLAIHRATAVRTASTFTCSPRTITADRRPRSLNAGHRWTAQDPRRGHPQRRHY
jgi:CheY-like chemotaxis protein